MDAFKCQDFSLVSSSIAANLYKGDEVTLWAAGSFASGARVYYTGAEPHLVYDSLAAGNTAIPGTDPDMWLEREATDRYAMFDPFTNTLSTATYQITVEVDASRSNGLAIMSVLARTVDLELLVGGVVKQSLSIKMESISGPSFFDYAFNDLVKRSDLLWEYPQYPSATLKATITYRPGELVKVGMMKLGKKTYMGDTGEDARVGIIDYSKETTDTYARVSLTKGDYAKRVEIDLWLLNTQILSVNRKLTELRGINAIYNCNNPGIDYECLLVYGKFDRFDIDIKGTDESRCSILLKGATRGDLLI